MMRTDATAAAASRPGFLSRILGQIRIRLRRMFGKDEPPNIYPFF